MSINLSDLDGVKPVGPADEHSIFSGTKSQKSPYTTWGKRGLDIALVLLAMPIVLPVIAICALLVMRDGHGPFYTQPRIGKDGRTFRIWKLRTMVPNAKAELETYLAQNPEARAEWELRQKLTNDPRITLVGKLLRKTSLDELPQLFNVLGGSMSLVGPRPMMPEQSDDYFGSAYYKLRPGITGFWQISRRHNSPFAARAKYDDEYFRALSLFTDVGVLMRTVRVVLRGTGC